MDKSLNITVDCTQCGQRKLMLVPLSELGQYTPAGKVRGKLIYTGICTVCKNKQ